MERHSVRTNLSATPPRSKSWLRRCLRGVRRRLAAIPQAVLLGVGLLFVPYLTRGGERRLANAIAWLLCRPLFRWYRYARTNVDLAFGDRLSDGEKDRIVRESFRSTALVLTDYLWFSRRTRERVARHCEIGDETVRRWVEGDFAGTFVTAHFGNWELAGLMVASRGRRLWSVYRPLGCAAVSRWMRRFRGRAGQRIIPREGAMRGVLRALRQRDVVALLLDQHVSVTEGAAYLDFFGLPATFSTAVGTLSHRLRTPVLVCAAVRDGERDAYVLRTVREFSAEETARTDPLDLTRGIVRAYEEMIRRHPEQWVWAYRRWKRWQPGDDPKRFPWYAREDRQAPPFDPAACRLDAAERE